MYSQDNDELCGYITTGKYAGPCVRKKGHKELRPGSQHRTAAGNVNNSEANCRLNRALREKVAVIKVERGCTDCGFNGHPAALHFDHLRDKVAGIASMVGKLLDWAIIEAEIAKCQVRCANCHAIKTAERGYYGVKL